MASVFDVSNKINIRKVLTHYTGEDYTATHGNVSCPFHDDKKPSFRIYDKTNTFHCFSCNESGTPINFVASYLNLTPQGAAEQIAQDFNLDYSKPKADPEYEQYVKVYNHMAKFFNALNNHREAVQHGFWKARGLESLISEYLLGYCPEVFLHRKKNTVMTLKQIILSQFKDMDPDLLDTYGLYDKHGNSIMAGRFVFPIMDSRGNVVGFSGRAVSSGVPKYLNTAETKYFKKRSLLYNWHEAKKHSHVFVVEGYTDALALVAQGQKNVVASMGTAITSDHLNLMKDKQIVLALDNDLPGRCRMVDIIENHPEVVLKVYELKGYEDFNAAHMAGADCTINIDKETVYGPEYLIRFFKEELDLGFLYKREELYRRVSAVSKQYSPVARDYFSTILKRLLKGARS